jgi:predicted nucleic acid-binding protein
MPGWRVVLDTNVVLAAHRSEAATSPNREILTWWKAGEFTLLYSEDVLIEYVEKLLLLGTPAAKLEEFITMIGGIGERVAIRSYHLRRYPNDADDIAFVLCALNGEATHLVTYDGGFAEVVREFDFAICEPLAFLAELRRDRVS